MGLISSVKGQFSDALVGEVVTGYGLKRSENAYLLWTGQVSGILISLEQGYDKKSWRVIAGDLGPDADREDSILLERFDPADLDGELEPEEDLGRFPALAGSAAARQFMLAGPPGSGDYSVLERQAVRDYLSRFSAAVEYIDLYFNRRAVMIGLTREPLDRAGFDRDLSTAIELAKALGG